MIQNPVGWFEIYVEDMERAKHFYETVFQIELHPLPVQEIQMLAFPMEPDSEGASGALVRVAGFPAGGNTTIVYFSCSDCAVEAGRVEAAGGRLKREKMPIGKYGFCALAFDSEGNLVGLHSRQ